MDQTSGRGEDEKSQKHATRREEGLTDRGLEKKREKEEGESQFDERTKLKGGKEGREEGGRTRGTTKRGRHERRRRRERLTARSGYSVKAV